MTSSGRGLLLCLFILIPFTPLLANETQPDVIAGPVLHLGHEGLWLHLVAKGLKAPQVEWRFVNRSAVRESLKRIRKNSWVSPSVSLNLSPKAYRFSDGTWTSPWHDVSISPSRDGLFSFALYGDNRSGSGDELVHRLLVKKIVSLKPDLVIHTGDLIVNANRLRHWRHFFREVAPLASRIPFMAAKGNHDVSDSGQFEKFFPINGGKPYYNFDFGGVTFIALDTTINFRRGSAQYRFLEKTLRSHTPGDALIVFFHHPPFSHASHGPDHKLQGHLVPLFSRYGVDAVFSGHEHGYQRFRTINGVSYVIAAGGGAPLYHVEAHPSLESFRVLYNFLMVTVDRSKKMRARMINAQGAVEDEFEISL